MNENVTPIRKTDRYPLYTGHTTLNGTIIERECIGYAYFKPGSKMFRIKIWLFPKSQYFLASEDNDSAKYTLLALDEYPIANGENRSQWHPIGKGEFVGNFIKIKIHLMPDEIYLSLFPDYSKIKGDEIAA